jgi:hypothetical protein
VANRLLRALETLRIEDFSQAVWSRATESEDPASPAVWSDATK